MTLTLADLNFGNVDAKLEFSDARRNSPSFFDSYLVPENIRIEDFERGKRYFIKGFRGTGKTSLLRYFLYRMQSKQAYRRMVLFKSDIDEDHRVSLSNQVGYDWTQTDSSKMEISQDFKSSWRWFVLHKIGEILKEDRTIATNDTEVDLFLDLLGLGGKTTVGKVLGVFPRLKGGTIEFNGNIGVISAKLQADFETKSADRATISLRAVVAAAEAQLLKIVFRDSVYIGFDELEAFFTDAEKFKRDLSMVRDLLFVVDQINQRLRATTSPVYLVAAIRSEVLHSMKALGQEVERSVHDSGVNLSWHGSARSMDHPLLQIIRKKLTASGLKVADPILEIMPTTVFGDSLDKYLLDSSFYKPRDIVWRLTLIQQQYPNSARITQQHFQDTIVQYSQQMWSEIAYELNATYSAAEVDSVKLLLSGFWRYFQFENFVNHARQISDYSSAVRQFLSKRDLHELLHNLYRLVFHA